VKLKRGQELSNLDMAAIFVTAIGKQHASILLGEMDDASLVILGQRMSELGKVDTKTVNHVVSHFLKKQMAADAAIHASRDDVVHLYRSSIENDRAERLIEDMGVPRRESVWKKLSSLKPEAIMEQFFEEHPQVIAVMMSNIKADLARRVLLLMPEQQQLDVLMRMSKIESVPRRLIEDIEDVLERDLVTQKASESIHFDGMGRVVDILKGLKRESASVLLEGIEDRDKPLFHRVDALMLTFEDLEKMSDRDTQQVLKKVSSEVLMKALKGGSDELQALFLRNMSQRAAEMMQEDMDALGPVKLSEVESCQRDMLKVIKDLDDAGLINLNASDMLS